jgi:membrane associated rhomboid family serine protease
MLRSGAMASDTDIREDAPHEEERPQKRGSRRRRRPGPMPVRRIGRNLLVFASIDTLVALLLPWISTDRGSINAFALGSEVLSMPEARWIGVVIWASVLAAAASIAVAVVDRRRCLGTVPAAMALVIGACQVGASAYLFETLIVFRQVGAVAFGLGGLVFFGSGALLARARWTPEKSLGASLFARPQHLPWMTIALCALSVLAYLALGFRDDYETDIMRRYGIIGGSLTWYAPLTCIFLHTGWFHLIANVAVLAAVGSAIERKAGRGVFAAVYFAGGIAGALLSAFIDPRIHMPLVGSSGAVAGVLGLCLALAPQQRVTIWFHAIVSVVRLEMQGAWVFSAWIALQAVGSFYLAMGEPDGIAYWGHLGGVAIGLGAGLIMRALQPGKAHLTREHADENAPPERAGGARTAHRRFGTSPLASVPIALTAVALVLSVLSAILSFTSGSLIGEMAAFASDWNTGRLDAVAEHFVPAQRQRNAVVLARIMNEMDPRSSEGSTRVRIALVNSLQDADDECRASFRATVGEDPYRARGGGLIRVVFRQEGGRWWVVAIRFTEVIPSGSPSV